MKRLASTLKNGALRAQNAVMMRMAGVKSEREAGDHLLEVLGTIIVAVVLLFLFKEEIVKIFQNATNHTDASLNTLFNGR